MKIHVVKPQQEAIENFKKVVCFNNSIDLSEISDNECDVIMANDAVDLFSIDKIGEMLGPLVKKLRLNGTLVVGGTDLRVLCKSVVNDQISEQDASNIISSLSSATNLRMVKAMAESMGLNVVSTQLSGIHYEITIKRS